MRWDEFLRRKSEYKDTWEKLKSEYSGDIKKFLDSSYTVIAYNFGQIAFDADAFSIARDNPDFFVQGEHSLALIRLAKEYKALENEPTSNKRNKFLKQVAGFDLKRLSVLKNRSEVRFSTLKMPFIQEIKESKYCDQKATDMSMISIRVVLKGGDDL